VSERITLVCGKPGHGRDIARFSRNEAGDWQAAKGGSWEISVRPVEVLSESVQVDPLTGTSTRTRRMAPARDRWRFWCLTCEHNHESKPLVIRALTLSAVLDAFEIAATSSATLEDVRHAARPN